LTLAGFEPRPLRHTDNEPKAGMLRLVMGGGRATEPSEAGPAGAGCIGVGTRALSESGTAGGWKRQQVRRRPWPRQASCSERCVARARGALPAALG
jgi:hypothetical protein